MISRIDPPRDHKQHCSPFNFHPSSFIFQFQLYFARDMLPSYRLTTVTESSASFNNKFLHRIYSFFPTATMPMKRNLLMTSLGTRVIKRNMANFIIAGDSAALQGIKTTPGKKIFYFVSQLALNSSQSFK